MKILIVEDYEPFLLTLTETLRRIRPEAKVRSARTIADAEDVMFQDGAPDVILLDLGLPDSQGFDGLGRLLAKAQSASVAIISGDANSARVKDAFVRGARAYIPKALPPEQFEEGLAKFLANGFFVPAAYV